ncbi:MAG: FAD-dependent oxidoreductase [Candidatus Omnitrophota bacterium]
MKVKFVPTQSLTKRLKNFYEVELGFSKKVAVDEARKFPQSNLPSCQPKCPLGINILEFIRFLREGDVGQAYKKIREQNSLPAICGRLCQAPCEEDFVIGNKKVPIEVRALERFVADYGRPKMFGRERLTCAKKRVAIVGSGPAGLAAAAMLGKDLFCVTVFESLPLLGGVLRYGIPDFRLPESILDAEIDQIRDLGVELKTNVTIGLTPSFEQLFTEGFSVILIAAGRSRPKFSGLPGLDAAGVFYAQELLMALKFFPDVFKKKFNEKLGQKVLIIGTQSAALDCARACRRLGKRVEIVFPGTIEDLDVHRNELKYGKEEGVELQPMTKPVGIEVDDSGMIKGVRCKRMDFAEKNGEWVLTPVPDGEVELQADSVVIADKNMVSSLIKRVLPDLKFNKDGTVWIDERTGETSIPRIFAAGDMVVGGEHILDAMVSGKRAAEHISGFLKES